MPAIRRSNIGRRTRIARTTAYSRLNRNDEQREERNELERLRLSQSRSEQTQEEREDQIVDNRLRMRHHRAYNRTEYNLNNRIRRQATAAINTQRAAFHYDNTIDYSADRSVMIGSMSKKCQHCKALKFANETPGLCCANGKVKLPVLNPPPEPLRSLMSGTGSQSTHFLTNIQKYNSCFQMTSFGATNVIRDNFMPTYKVSSSNTAAQSNIIAQKKNCLFGDNLEEACSI